MRICVFINASNLWAAQKSKAKFINYSALTDFISKTFNAESVKVFYYDAYPADGTRPYSLDGKHKFYTCLKKGLGFAVITKKLKRIRELTESGEIYKEKGNMDVEITIDAMLHFEKYDSVVFLTGDSDFLALVTYLKNHNKKVYVFSSKNNISEELRTGSDGYTDILLIDEIWGKEIQHREQLRK